MYRVHAFLFAVLSFGTLALVSPPVYAAEPTATAISGGNRLMLRVAKLAELAIQTKARKPRSTLKEIAAAERQRIQEIVDYTDFAARRYGFWRKGTPLPPTPNPIPAGSFEEANQYLERARVLAKYVAGLAVLTDKRQYMLEIIDLAYKADAKLLEFVQ